MAFNNYLEDEKDKPYFTTNSLAYYYDKMEGFAKAVEGSAKALNLTKEEVEKRLTLYIEQNKNELDQRLAQWDGKLETFDSSVETLLSEWVDDGTLTPLIDSTLIDQKIAPVTTRLAETDQRIATVIANAGDGTIPSELVDIRTVNNKTYTTAGQAVRAIAEGTGIKKGAISGEKTDFIVPGKNRFDKSKAVLGFAVGHTNGQLLASELYFTSDFTPVIPGETVKQSHKYTTALYNENGVFVTGTGSSGSAFYTIPDGVRLAKYSALRTVIDVFQFEKGTVTTDYESFRKTLHPSVFIENYNLGESIPQENEVIPSKGKWDGETIVSFGDSITWYDEKPFGETHSDAGQIAKGYLSYMREELGATVINKGYSGYRMQQLFPIISNFNFAAVDAVTLTAGANDYRYPDVEPLGAIAPIGSAFDVNTFYGSMQAAVESILNRYPEMKIYLISPIKGWDDTRGDMSPAYPNAWKEVGALYALPVCDWYTQTGINDLTKDSYIGDDETTGFKLHPTNKGYARMAEILIPFLKTH